MDQKKIGKFLKELRKEKGITQEELNQFFGDGWIPKMNNMVLWSIR